MWDDLPRMNEPTIVVWFDLRTLSLLVSFMLFEQSGLLNKAAFIKARVFNETFRVIKVDRSLLDYYQKLTTLYGQFRSVGVNYNQTVVVLKSNFTEKKAFAMLAKLEKLTLELVIIGGEIVQLTREFQEKWQHRQ